MVAEQPAQLVAGQRGLALGVDDPPFVVDDADDFELHGSCRRATRIIARRRPSADRVNGTPVSNAPEMPMRSCPGRRQLLRPGLHRRGTVALPRSAARRSLLARAVDGETVLWVESLRRRRRDDRLLVLREIRDLEMAVPPPESIDYHDLTLRAAAGRRAATIEIDGRGAGARRRQRCRSGATAPRAICYLQIEEGGGRVFMLAGESVHRGMIDILPGR